MKRIFTTNSQDETESLGNTFSSELKNGDVVAFFGELGAGKTAFIRGTLRGLGVAEAVTSPTFNIINEYRSGRIPVAHFDMYRIENDDALTGTGFYDYLDDTLILLEWAEHIPWALDDNTIRISIDGSGEEPRQITIERKETK